MTTSDVLIVDSGQPLQTLQEAQEKVASSKTDLMLDFSAVKRVDPATLQALEGLAILAGDHHVNVALCGVDVAVYKVLKLAKLASQFSFAS
jgi:anti-anti-sigma regulatory factor